MAEKKSNKATPKPKSRAKQRNKAKKYTTNLYPGDAFPLPTIMGGKLAELENLLGMPVWVLIQGSNPKELSSINDRLWRLFLTAEHDLNDGEQIALIIDSPGGYAKSAYQIARLFRQKCGSFQAYIPRYAKSAATLLVLGSQEVHMGRHAELGPLDAQYIDSEREAITSALDTVLALERLRAFALESIDEAMMLMIGRTGKKIETILPYTLHFVAEMVQPLFDKIDVIEFTKMSRVLKVAEEYAWRLLVFHKTRPEAESIARHLVEHYPEHDFFIGPDEARDIGIPVTENSPEIDATLDDIYHILSVSKVTAFGRVVEYVEQKDSKSKERS